MICFHSFFCSILLAVTICLDPGHGGRSTGAVGEYILEKDVVLQVALQLQNWLCQVPGITRVSLTRDGDYNVSLQARTDYANAVGFDMFVSIHENAYNGAVQGTETFCGSLDPGDSSYQMAELVQQGILDAYDYNDRGVKDGSHLHVIRETEMPAILGEGSFLDYDLDWNESLLYAENIDDHTGVQAWAYADAIASYWGLVPPEYDNGVVLLDNSSAGFSVNDSTLWQSSSSGAPWMGGCLLGNGGEEAVAQWTAPFTVQGARTLGLWWTSGSNRSQSVLFRVYHSGGYSDVTVDQLGTGGGEWVECGTWSFNGEFTVQLLCEESGSGVAVADAVRLVYPMGAGEETVPVALGVNRNPSSSFIFSGGDSGAISIYDCSGRMVDVLEGESPLSWNPSDLSPGIYFALSSPGEPPLKLVLVNR